MRLHFLLALFSVCNAYKIFIYSTPMGFSHIQLMESVATTLHNAGHEVTVAHPVLEERFRTYWDKSPARKVYSNAPHHVVKTHHARTENIWITPPLGGNLKTVQHLMSIQQQLCDAFLNETEIIQQLKDENFDIGIFEVFGACGLGLGEIIGVKTHVMMSAIGLIDALGPMFHSPFMPSYVPGGMTLYTDQMTFFQRFINLGWAVLTDVVYERISTAPYERIFAFHGHPFNLKQVLKDKANFILSNSDEFLDLARPLSRKVKHIGGIALGSVKNVTGKFGEILTQRSKGTVVISFGSVAPTSSMPSYIKQGILDTVKQFPDYTFIWKTDEGDLELSKEIDNLETSKWIPQRELLYDSRTKLFVTHAGLNSILETARTGKPAILVPIFGDQFKNAGHMQRKNTSIVIEKDIFTGDLFRDAVKTILGDISYAQRAQRLSDLMSARKETPADRLLEAIEFSGKFGKIKDLDIYGFEMGFIQYFCIDVISVWVLLFSLVLYVIYRFLNIVFCKNKLKMD